MIFISTCYKSWLSFYLSWLSLILELSGSYISVRGLQGSPDRKFYRRLCQREGFYRIPWWGKTWNPAAQEHWQFHRWPCHHPLIQENHCWKIWAVCRHCCGYLLWPFSLCQLGSIFQNPAQGIHPWQVQDAGFRILHFPCRSQKLVPVFYQE